MAVAALLTAACPKSGDAPPAPAPTPPAAAPAPKGPVGTVEGHVTAKGKLPVFKPQPLDASLHKQCGTAAPDLSLTVAADGSLLGAVASIDDAAPTPLPAGFAPAFMDQKACVYRPSVVATRAGQNVKVKNSDPLLHNVRAMDGKSPVFNVAMPVENLTIDKPLPATPGVVRLHCDVHPWMTAWIATFAHDLYAVTDDAGRFRIANVPVGKHPLKLWHPRLGDLRVDVEVKENAVSTIEAGWDIADTPAP